jgi:putative ABC transport system permease protein
MTSLLQDLRFGLRMLRKNPGHSLAAVAALGLGIGLVTAMFSIVYGAMLRGLPFDESERLMHLENNNPSRDEPSLEVFPHDFLDWRERQTSFEELAGYHDGTVNLSGDGDPERFDGAFVSASTFKLLRVEPLLGRGFRPEEESPQAPLPVVLGHGVWRTRYSGDPKVLGKPVRVNGEPGTIVGVMPQGFEFPESQEVWVPLRFDPVRLQRGEGDTLEVLGRLRDGVTLETARTEMEGIAGALAAAHPKTNEGRGAVVKPWIEEEMGPEIAGLLWTMLGACIAVLLIACANVASLMTAKASRRTREIVIRSALGASRGRVIVQLLVESLVVAVLGALVGVLLARWGIQVFNSVIAETDPPFWIRIAVDLPALLFAFGTTLVAAVVSGLLPALQASRTDLNEVLKDEGRGSSSLRVGWMTRVVVVGEVAFSCLLLVSAGLMIKSVVNIQKLDPGFDAGNILTARIALFETTYPEEAQRVRFAEQLLERLAAQPGVTSAAAMTSFPGLGSWVQPYELEGKTYSDERDYPIANTARITPSYFETFGVRLLAGRGFGQRDTLESLPVVIVNKSFAERVWPGEDPVGKRIRLKPGGGAAPEPWRTVVGIAPDLQMEGLNNEGRPEGFYLPLSQEFPNFFGIAVKTRAGDPLALTSAVRDQVKALDADLPIYFVRSLEENLSRASFFPNLFGSLFAIFGIAALLLASVGIYGVIAFSVHQRTQEIGIRMALGARRENVFRMILRQGMLQLLVGLSAGLTAAVFASSLLASFLFKVEPRDPATFAIVSGLLAAVAFLACWIPAQKAMRTDPLVAIRYD